MDTQKIKKEMRLLKGYTILSLAVFTLLFFSSFKTKNQRFSEIDVERINIIKEDGTIDMVITNAARVPDPIMDGKVIGKRQGNALPALGIYNDEGDEIGGFTYGVSDYNGQKVAKTALLFDQYKNDEVMQLFYQEVIGGNGKIAGLEIKDRPEGVSIIELSKMFQEAQALEGEEKVKVMTDLQNRSAKGEFGGSRLFVGAVNGEPILMLNDAAGRSRIKIYVDTEGNPKLQFLDEKGEVTHSIPEN